MLGLTAHRPLIKKEAWADMPRLYVKVVGLPYAKMWNKQLHAYDVETALPSLAHSDKFPTLFTYKQKT